MDARRLRFSEDAFSPTRVHRGRGEVLFRRATVREPGSRINFVDFTVVPPGVSIGLHRHTDGDEEIYLVLAGSGSMLVGDTEIDVQAEDVIINPPGGTHSLSNTGSVPIRLAVIDVALSELPYSDPIDLEQ